MMMWKADRRGPGKRTTDRQLRLLVNLEKAKPAKAQRDFSNWNVLGFWNESEDLQGSHVTNFVFDLVGA